MLKTMRLFKKLVLKVLEPDNNKVIRDSGGNKANKTDEISIKFKNPKKLLKIKKFEKTSFKTTYFFKL